jgi:hypothetical protein
MSLIESAVQPLACTVGFHVLPNTRVPHGPIVATCLCCNKTVYYYGLSAYGVGVTPNLMLQQFPRVLNAIPTTAALPSGR